MKSALAFFRQFSSNPLISEMAEVSSLFASANSVQRREEILLDLLTSVIEETSGEASGISVAGSSMEYGTIVYFPKIFSGEMSDMGSPPINDQQRMQFVGKFHVLIEDCICAFMDRLFQNNLDDERNTFIETCRGYIQMLEMRPELAQTFYSSSRFSSKWRGLFDTTTRPNNCIFVYIAFWPVIMQRPEIFDPLKQPYSEMLQEAQRVFLASQNNTSAAQSDVTTEDTTQPSSVLATATVVLEVSAENISSSSDAALPVLATVVPGVSFSFVGDASNAADQNNNAPASNSR